MPAPKLMNPYPWKQAKRCQVGFSKGQKIGSLPRDNYHFKRINTTTGQNAASRGSPDFLSKLSEKIGYYREQRKKKKTINENLIQINRSKFFLEALNLPRVLNVNPRSIYNKKDEFETFVKEYEINVICMSESWERESLSLSKLLTLDNYEIISSLNQRKEKGGRPAIIVDKSIYHVENITNKVKLLKCYI